MRTLHDHMKKLIAEEKLICPECQKPVRKFDKLVATNDSFWDGAGDSEREATASIVTLICSNEGCKWQERTEYWDNYMKD